jgi:hypothetical protein
MESDQIVSCYWDLRLSVQQVVISYLMKIFLGGSTFQLHIVPQSYFCSLLVQRTIKLKIHEGLWNFERKLMSTNRKTWLVTIEWLILFVCSPHNKYICIVINKLPNIWSVFFYNNHCSLNLPIFCLKHIY